MAASGYEDFCFGGPSSWACSGDSGGPLIGHATPEWDTAGPLNTIYGLTSFGDASGCSSAILLDSVAQAVGPHFGWITGFFCFF